jgi:hypothetical protein
MQGLPPHPPGGHIDGPVRLNDKVRHERGGEFHVGGILGIGTVRGMKELALRCRPVGEGTKPPYAALAEDRCGERYGKGVG